MKYRGFIAVLIGCAFFACSKSTNADKFQRSGAFVLAVPSDTAGLGPRADSASGYSVQDNAYTSTATMLDVQLSNFINQAESSSVQISSSGIDQGGLIIGAGTIAPDYAYAYSLLVRFKKETYPLQLWLLCRDNVHYCQLWLDSMTVAKVPAVPNSTVVCNGYFRYTLNLDKNERQF